MVDANDAAANSVHAGMRTDDVSIAQILTPKCEASKNVKIKPACLLRDHKTVLHMHNARRWQEKAPTHTKHEFDVRAQSLHAQPRPPAAMNQQCRDDATDHF